jgi:hypothetical protein
MIFSALALAATPVALPAGCEHPVKVSSATVRRVVGHRLSRRDTIVMGVERQTDGNPQATVYVSADRSWRAYTLNDSQQIVGSLKIKGGLLVFGWHNSEGPGEGFNGLLFDKNNIVLACPALDAHEILNYDERTRERDWSGEYPSLERLAIDRLGSVIVEASADIQVYDKPVHVTYRYVSADGGRSWSPARLTGPSAQPGPRAGRKSRHQPSASTRAPARL